MEPNQICGLTSQNLGCRTRFLQVDVTVTVFMEEIFSSIEDFFLVQEH